MMLALMKFPQYRLGCRAQGIISQGRAQIASGAAFWISGKIGVFWRIS
jgi:hypothetical protein